MATSPDFYQQPPGGGFLNPVGGTGGGFYKNPNGTPSPYDPTNNYGDSGMSYDAYSAKYGTPEQQGGAGAAAGAAASAAGTAQANNPAVNPNLPNSTVPGSPGAVAGGDTPGALSGPGYAENYFATHGNDLSGPSSSTKLFNEGAAGTNPFYMTAMKEADDAIREQSALAGTGNSTATTDAIGLANASLLGQQAMGLTNLAGQSDSADTGRYTASNNASVGAQNSTDNRINQIVSGYTSLSSDQANMVQNFYKMAEDGQLQTNMAAIEAQMQAAGVDAATMQAITNDLIQIGGIAAKAGSGK